MNYKHFRLVNATKEPHSRLWVHVAQWVLDKVFEIENENDNDHIQTNIDTTIETVFAEFNSFGTAIVSHLNSFHDCWSFFNAYYIDLENIRIKTLEIKLNFDLGKNDLASELSRFGFSWCMRELQKYIEEQ